MVTIGHVGGRFILPSGTPATGQIYARPVSEQRIPDEPLAVTAARSAVEFTLDENGECHGALVTGAYTISALIDGASTESWQIVVTDEHTAEKPLDLTLAAPLPIIPTERFVVNELVYREALEARDQAEESAHAAEEARRGMIVGARFDGDELVLTNANGEEIARGEVRGEQGAPGKEGPPGPAGDPTAYDLRGEGFPTNRPDLAASPIGTIYTDTIATCGAVRWIKTAAGWKVEYGNTGWRKVPMETSAVSQIYVLRDAERVWIRFERSPASNTAVNGEMLVTAANLGNEFLPKPFAAITVTSQTNGQVAVLTGSQQGTNARGIILRAVGGIPSYLACDTSYAPTSDAWPTTLPGTPA